MKQGKSVDKVWARLKGNLLNITQKLRSKYKFFTIEIEDLMADVQWKFYELYYKDYENDKQFMRFMFVVTKNVIHDLQRKEYRYVNHHTCNLRRLKNVFQIPLQEDAIDENYVRIINEMAVDKKFENKVQEKMIYRELIEEVDNILQNPTHIKIFHLILDQYKPIHISEEVNKPVGYIGQVKRNKIFPAVKEVLNMSDEDYKWHSASGRIFIKSS